MIVRVKGRNAWFAHRDPETGGWIGECDSLNLTAYGDTWDELLQSIVDIQQALLNDLLQEGALTRFLRDHGWKPEARLPSRARIPREGVQFDLPTTVTPMAA